MVAALSLAGCLPGGGPAAPKPELALDLGRIPITPTIEDRDPEGYLYNPGTQSLLREYHWLEKHKDVHVTLDTADRTTWTFKGNDDIFLKIANFPTRFILPTLYYKPASPPDDFDAFNLMLAEFSRNGVSVPFGRPEDEMHHYETNLKDTVPWKLRADFDFIPNPYYKPLRVSVVNNCLRAGLWEIQAKDRSGTIYQAWFNLPEQTYYQMVARNSAVGSDFVKKALRWHERKVPLDLDRLRRAGSDLGPTWVQAIDDEVSYSSDDSRRKLRKHYVQILKDGKLTAPATLGDLQNHPVRMSRFIEPGKYSYTQREDFEFGFLASPMSASVKVVRPRTRYHLDADDQGFPDVPADDIYIEITIQLTPKEKIVIGNLPLHLLVLNEDFAIHGYGVGVMKSSGPAEARNFLYSEGPAPSYAYLAEDSDGKLLGLNTHRRGLEQIFIRSHPLEKKPYWEIILSSYERIVDLAKYRVGIPEKLQERQRKHTFVYTSPLYRSYRDDNVR